jgi:tRNA nucleotidyltransferase (CCA-adding enzyme)
LPSRRGFRTEAKVSFPARLEVPASILQIAQTLDRAGFEAWCVGGTLRDALLDEPHADYDVATSATPSQVQRLFSRTVAVGVKYGTVGVLDQERVLHEVTTFRRDVLTDGRHAVVQYGASLEEDLARRDFTINAIAYHPLRHEWRDPFDGAKDLAARLVRAVGDPRQRFEEDYLRILRAIRFAARFDFVIDSPTWEAARAAAEGLRQLSAERVRDEWFKGVQTARSLRRLVSLWIDIGAARVLLPELETDRANSENLDESAFESRDPILVTALLTDHPSRVLGRLKASNAQIDRARAVEAGPPGPDGDDRVAVRRWMSRVGAAADDLSLLWRLRHGAEPPWHAAMLKIREEKDPLARSELAITGSDLLAIGISGPRVGQILSQLLDRVLEQPALNTRDALLALARERS